MNTIEYTDYYNNIYYENHSNNYLKGVFEFE